MIDFLQDVFLVLHVLDLLQPYHVRHGQYLHRPVLVGDFIPAQAHTPECARSYCWWEKVSEKKKPHVSAILSF